MSYRPFSLLCLDFIAFIFRLVMIYSDTNEGKGEIQHASCRQKSEESKTKLGLFFYILWNRGWSKYCKLRDFFFSLVFVFQRLLCLPVHPAWNVAQKVDVVWSYQCAPECFRPQETPNASYFFESSRVNTIHNPRGYIMFNQFCAHWV